MSMTRKLFLHIGSPKCGSTYLQRVMLENRRMLAQHGIVYPTPAGGHPGNGTIVPELDGEGLSALFGNAGTVFLSHEDLFAMGGRLKRLGPLCAELGIDLVVLVFLRPFSEFIYGDYSQYLKQNIDSYIAQGAAYGGLSFEEFAVSRRSQITPVGWLKAWQRTTGTPLRIAHHPANPPSVGRPAGPLAVSLGDRKVEIQPVAQGGRLRGYCQCDLGWRFEREAAGHVQTGLQQGIVDRSWQDGGAHQMARGAVQDPERPHPGGVQFRQPGRRPDGPASRGGIARYGALGWRGGADNCVRSGKPIGL